MNRFLYDYETQSEVDLKKVGAIEYAKHPSTKIICVGYKRNHKKSRLWVPDKETIPNTMYKAAKDDSYIWTAHNALFEWAITEYVLPRYGYNLGVKLNRFKCTAAKAAACALPRSLEGVGAALKLPIQKNMDGRRLVLKYMKPTQKWVKWNEAGRIGPEPKKWHDDEFELWSLYDYCITDVDTEALVDNALPDLIPYEQDAWVVNQEHNVRGIQIDTNTARKILTLRRQQVKKLQKRVAEITDGEVNSVLQVKATLNWLKDQGYEYSNLRANTVDDALEDEELPDNVRELFTIRKVVSKASIKKYNAMLTRAGADGRVRDLTMYHGANTGREAGRGLQIQNFPRGIFKGEESYTAIDIINDCERIEDLEIFYKEPAEVFSSCLRGMVTASKGKELFVADFNAIECRLVNWFADQKDVLKAFWNNEDLYVLMASIIFNVPVKKVTEDQRFVGKQAVLGGGYGLGWKKFIVMCAGYGRTISDDIAKRTIDAYRKKHDKVVKMWDRVEYTAIKAVQNKGKRYTVHKCTWFYEDGFLWCQLPSGRRLAFYGATVRNSPTPWGEMRPKLYYWRTNPRTKKWENCGTYGGSLVESMCQATARDLTVNGIKQVRADKFDYLFQVHDEVIAERDKGSRTKEDYVDLLTRPPAWAKGLPIKAGGWVNFRYRK